MKKKNEIIRVQQLLENDRVNGEDNFLNLVKGDISDLLSDYFVLSSGVDLILTQKGDRIKVEMIFMASRVKNFLPIPKQ